MGNNLVMEVGELEIGELARLYGSVPPRKDSRGAYSTLEPLESACSVLPAAGRKMLGKSTVACQNMGCGELIDRD